MFHRVLIWPLIAGLRPFEVLKRTYELHMITCAEMISKSQPAIKPLEAEIEKLSRECVYKIHMHNLWLD